MQTLTGTSHSWQTNLEREAEETGVGLGRATGVQRGAITAPGTLAPADKKSDPTCSLPRAPSLDPSLTKQRNFYDVCTNLAENHVCGSYDNDLVEKSHKNESMVTLLKMLGHCGRGPRDADCVTAYPVADFGDRMRRIRQLNKINLNIKIMSQEFEADKVSLLLPYASMIKIFVRCSINDFATTESGGPCNMLTIKLIIQTLSIIVSISKMITSGSTWGPAHASPMEGVSAERIQWLMVSMDLRQEKLNGESYNEPLSGFGSYFTTLTNSSFTYVLCNFAWSDPEGGGIVGLLSSAWAGTKENVVERWKIGTEAGISLVCYVFKRTGSAFGVRRLVAAGDAVLLSDQPP